MKFGKKVIGVLLLAILFFAVAEFMPVWMGKLMDKQTIGQAVVTKDTASNNSAHMHISDEEKYKILSVQEDSTYLFKAKDLAQLLDYDSEFLSKLKKQLERLKELKVMDFSDLCENLTDSFVGASYYSVTDQFYGTNGFAYWQLKFNDEKNQTEYEIAFDLDSEKIYYFYGDGKSISQFWKKQKGKSEDEVTQKAKRVQKYMALYHSGTSTAFNANWNDEMLLADGTALIKKGGIKVPLQTILERNKKQAVEIMLVTFGNLCGDRRSSLLLSGSVAISSNYDA